MNIYLNMLRHAGKLRTFDAANEGKPGGDDAAAKAAAEAALAASADQAAIDKAKADADEAAKDAKSGDADAVKLAAEKAELLREVMDKKTKLAEKDKALVAANEALKAFEGIDPAEIRVLLQAKAAAEKSALEAKGDFESVKKMMAEEHAKEKTALLATLEEEREARKKDRGLINELTIGNSFGNSSFIKDSLVLSPDKTRQLYGSHFEVKEGRVVAYDKPASSETRNMLVNSAGDPLAFEEALTRIVDADPDKKSVMKSRMKPGAGSTTTEQQNNQNKQNDNGLYGRSRIAASLHDFK